jgi:hypothetical protein|tara:strand:- start:5345 stop:5713 length:369 start_codon:yes stop_codon:yes gene_type:complete
MGIRGPKPGTPRVGGREKGTPNKKTVELQERVKKFMQQQGIKNFDPLVALAGIAVDKATPLKLKVESLKELAQYLHPKRRAVEVSGEQTINVQEKEKKIKEIDDLLEQLEGKKITQDSDVLN